MPKPFDMVALLSSAAMTARKAETYSPETYVIDLAELRQIIFEMQRMVSASPVDSGTRMAVVRVRMSGEDDTNP